MKISESQSLQVCRGDRTQRQAGRWINKHLTVDIRTAMVLALVPAFLAVSFQGRSQSLSISDNAAANAGITYIRPTPRITVKNYVFDAFGPFAFVGTVLTASLDQETNTPPEWKQGSGGYAKRFGSDFGIAVAGTTARYGAAAAFKDDTSYYRCECRGVFPRMGHAVLATLTARRGQNGHRIFSFPALAAPYVSSITAVYGWYPSRYGVKDAFRMGNYSLLESIGTNVGLEFLYSGPHFLLSRMRLNHAPGAPDPGPKQ